MYRFLFFLFILLSSSVYAQGDNPDIAFAKNTFARIQTQDLQELAKTVKPDILAKVKDFKEILPPTSPDEALIYINEPKANLVSLQYRFSKEFYLFTVKMDKQQITNWEIIHLNGGIDEQLVFPILNSILFLATFVFIIKMLYNCLAIKTEKKFIKYTWLLFIVCGLGSFNYNSLTGYSDFTVWSIVLFGVNISQEGLLSTWILHTGLPLGALMFYLLEYKRLDN